MSAMSDLDVQIQIAEGAAMACRTYQERIADLTKHEPRHVEAWMRLEHGTLDQLAPPRFVHEVCLASACVAAAGPEESEALARSYGL